MQLEQAVSSGGSLETDFSLDCGSFWRRVQQMIGAFQFEDGGKTFTCRVEGPRGARTESWWWFGVSGDQQRYAPFQAASSDTQKDVRARIISYYTDLLFRRSQPAAPRHHWAQRGKGTTPPAPATPAAPAQG